MTLHGLLDQELVLNSSLALPTVVFCGGILEIFLPLLINSFSVTLTIKMVKFMEELVFAITKMPTLINSWLELNKVTLLCARTETKRPKFRDAGEMSRVNIMDLFTPCIETPSI
jgi:hypothetical protein